MQSAIIADTSCLILLDKIGELDILNRLFGNIITTALVAEEFGVPLPDWIRISNPVDLNYQRIIQQSLDSGEASAIALAVEQDECLLIIDEIKGRKFAIELGLNITGTFGVLIEAKLSGHINAVKPILGKIKQTNFRFSHALETLILSKAGEV